MLSHKGGAMRLIRAVPPAGGSFCCYVERYFNKNLRAIYRGDTTPVVGVVALRFVIDTLGKCEEDQPVPAGGLWPDITVVYYPIQH
jgi:hypothetical protein